AQATTLTRRGHTTFLRLFDPSLEPLLLSEQVMGNHPFISIVVSKNDALVHT
ncbi:hypothetical protein ACJX0J_037448, partial [Zea mays]